MDHSPVPLILGVAKPSLRGARPLVERFFSAAAVLLALSTPLWLATVAFTQSPPDSTATQPDNSPSVPLQPVDTLRGSLSGLEGLSFGMTKEMVITKVSVPLHEGMKADLNAIFSTTHDVSQLQSTDFPVMPNENKPVKFVFRRGELFGVCVCVGRLSPAEYLKTLELLGNHYGAKGKPAGDMESFKAAIAAFGDGLPHERITLGFDDYRVVAQLSWNDANSASTLELVFKQREDGEPANPIDHWNRTRSRLGF